MRGLSNLCRFGVQVFRAAPASCQRVTAHSTVRVHADVVDWLELPALRTLLAVVVACVLEHLASLGPPPCSPSAVYSRVACPVVRAALLRSADMAIRLRLGCCACICHQHRDAEAAQQLPLSYIWVLTACGAALECVDSGVLLAGLGNDELNKICTKQNLCI